MDPKETVEKTVIKEIDLDLESIISPDSIITGDQDDKKPNVFKRPDVDLSFIDKETEEETEEKTEETIEDITDIQKEVIEEEVTKPVSVNIVKNLIEKKIIKPFDDDKSVDDYNESDVEELLEANITQLREDLYEEVAQEFVGALPGELQAAFKYVSDGGTDLKTLFRRLAAAEEIKELDPSNEAHQEIIVRNYLTATKFGNEDEIQEEIDSWKDRNELKNKAEKFKPKLDSMQQEVIAQNIKKQEGIQRKQQEQMKVYAQNIYETLSPGELNGIKLDKKAQEMLYVGLTIPQFPSVTGRQTNLLGHLLEKYQYKEPNHALLAEALWLLADPETYKKKVKESVTKEVTEKTVRTLKTEEAGKKASTEQKEQPDRSAPKIARPSPNFFKR